MTEDKFTKSDMAPNKEFVNLLSGLRSWERERGNSLHVLRRHIYPPNLVSFLGEIMDEVIDRKL